MSRIVMLTVLLLSLSSGTPAQTAADFSGTWKLDVSRSESPGFGGTVPRMQSIRQTGSSLIVLTDYGERSETLTYTAEGTERPLVGQEKEAAGSLRWEGTSLVTVIVRTINGRPVTSEQRRTLRADGREMMVVTMTKVEHGYNRPETLVASGAASSATDIYVKTGTQ